MKNGPRKLTVDDRVYQYSVRHQHSKVDTPEGPRAWVYKDCTERLTIWDDRRKASRLVITFVGGPDRAVGDGINPSGVVIRWLEDWYEDSVPPGVVARPHGILNLHRPGVARAMLDEAIARGWDTHSALELDGWDLFDAVHTRLGPDAARE